MQSYKISHEASEIAKRILDKVPKQEPRLPKVSTNIPKRGGMEAVRQRAMEELKRLASQDDNSEKGYLNKIAHDYNKSRDNIEEWLVAHGTNSASSLCQILLDGKLVHQSKIESYGGFGNNVAVDGHYDRGWGVFITSSKAVRENLKEEYPYRVISLDNFEVIVFPEAKVDIIRNEFPSYKQLIKGYKEFAEELNECF
jgi:hypothetical protein